MAIVENVLERGHFKREGMTGLTGWLRIALVAAVVASCGVLAVDAQHVAHASTGAVTVTVNALTADPGNPVDTGVTIVPGTTYTINASGSTNYCYTPSAGLSCPSGPAGATNSYGFGCGVPPDQCPIPTALLGTLVGRIASGPYFVIGSNYRFTAGQGQSGTLYLVYNDVPGYYGDNTGSYTVVVEEAHHYVVDIESWIPQQAVVDPLMPLPMAYPLTTVPPLSTYDPSCYTPLLHSTFLISVYSTYKGDGHTGFGGSYRLREQVQFDYDGTSISNFFETLSIAHVGQTERDKVYYLGDNRLQPLATCAQTGFAPNGSLAAQTGPTSFSIGTIGRNPLAPPGAPPILDNVSATIDASGVVSLSWTTTNFPSSGLSVTRDGVALVTGMTNDVSCLGSTSVLGPAGVYNLYTGLTHTHSNSGTADPSIPGTTMDLASPLC